MGMFVQGERACLPTSPPLHLSRLEQRGLSYLWHIFLIPRGVWSGEGSCRALPGSLWARVEGRLIYGPQLPGTFEHDFHPWFILPIFSPIRWVCWPI